MLSGIRLMISVNGLMFSGKILMLSGICIIWIKKKPSSMIEIKKLIEMLMNWAGFYILYGKVVDEKWKMKNEWWH